MSVKINTVVLRCPAITLSATAGRTRRGLRVPTHVGVIPDGNRRWAQARGLPKSAGYDQGIEPAKRFYEVVWDLGIREVSSYVFTKENMHRPKEQIAAFKAAFVSFLDWVRAQDVSVLLVGDTRSPSFPAGLEHLAVPEEDRDAKRRLNLLVNYSWKWDVAEAARQDGAAAGGDPLGRIGSRHVSRIDLVVRWGGTEPALRFPTPPVGLRGPLRRGRDVAGLRGRALLRRAAMVQRSGRHPGRLGARSGLTPPVRVARAP
jgi:undecaprenyl diphosphate synthase